MARRVSITREMIIAAGVDYVNDCGIGKLNVRSLAEHIGCSIQPIFRNFGTMEACRAEIVCGLEELYRAYIDERVDPGDRMFTLSLAHVQLAMDRPQLFELIFQAGLYRVRTVDEVIRSGVNREAVESIAAQYDVDIATAESVFSDVRFYSLGLAQAAFAGTVRFAEGECAHLLRRAIAAFLGREALAPVGRS